MANLVDSAQPSPIHTYTMVERSDRLDFEIRGQSVRSPVTKPHRHEYFQIFVNQGDLVGIAQDPGLHRFRDVVAALAQVRGIGR